MGNIEKQTLPLSNGSEAFAVHVHANVEIDQVIHALQLPKPRALLVLNGGTAELDSALKARLQRHIVDAVARLAAEEHITLVTGATDAGIFKLLGEGLRVWGRTAPCIGVTVDALVQRSDHRPGDTSLEPHHSHFVLVEGEAWGDETEVMYALIDTLAQDCPSVAVYAGGGQIVLREMEANSAQGRRMILLAGSGRSTDAVLQAWSGKHPDDSRIQTIARSGDILPFDINEEPAAFHALLFRSLFGDTSE